MHCNKSEKKKNVMQCSFQTKNLIHSNNTHMKRNNLRPLYFADYDQKFTHIHSYLHTSTLLKRVRVSHKQCVLTKTFWHLPGLTKTTVIPTAITAINKLNFSDCIVTQPPVSHLCRTPPSGHPAMVKYCVRKWLKHVCLRHVKITTLIKLFIFSVYHRAKMKTKNVCINK